MFAAFDNDDKDADGLVAGKLMGAVMFVLSARACLPLSSIFASMVRPELSSRVSIHHLGEGCSTAVTIPQSRIYGTG
jgi:hypothetical protein